MGRHQVPIVPSTTDDVTALQDPSSCEHPARLRAELP